MQLRKSARAFCKLSMICECCLVLGLVATFTCSWSSAPGTPAELLLRCIDGHENVFQVEKYRLGITENGLNVPLPNSLDGASVPKIMLKFDGAGEVKSVGNFSSSSVHRISLTVNS